MSTVNTVNTVSNVGTSIDFGSLAGFKVTASGALAWMASAFVNLEWASVVGIIGIVVGVVLQISNHLRAREKHVLEMQILKLDRIQRMSEAKEHVGVDA